MKIKIELKAIHVLVAMGILFLTGKTIMQMDPTGEASLLVVAGAVFSAYLLIVSFYVIGIPLLIYIAYKKIKEKINK